MKLSRRITKSILLFLLFSLSFFKCSRQHEDVLATVGSQKITAVDYRERFQSIRQKINVPDNGQTRMQVFRQMVDEILLVEEAIKKGYQDDTEGRRESERLKIQALLDDYYQTNLFDKQKVDDKDLQVLFRRLHTKIRARHLFAETRSQADSLHNALMSGRSFEELAKLRFKDPQLRDSGGDLGYFSVDEMDPFFEEAAFSLGIGQISEPVRTAQGYSIIQVLDRIDNPLVTESEYFKHKDKLQQYWSHRLNRKAARAYSDSLRKELDITFSEPAVRELLQFILDRRNQNPEIQNLSPNQIDPAFNDKEVARSKIGVWNGEAFFKQARYTSEDQLKWIRTQEHLEDFIAGLIIRAYTLDQAKKEGLNHTRAYQETVRKQMDDYLLKRMEAAIDAEVSIPEDTLQQYYEEYKDRFSIAPGIHLREIVLDREEKAREVRAKLAKRVPFDLLAKSYSVRRRSAEKGGDIGFFNEKDLGEHGDQIFKLKNGEWAGPMKMDGQFVFIQCIGREPTKELTYEEARPEILKQLKPVFRDEAKEKTLAAIRREIKVSVEPEKLKSISLN